MSDQPTTPPAPTPSSEFPQPPAGNPSAAPTPTGGEDPGKTLGIVGLILAFFVPLIGLILSILGNNKSKAAGFKNTIAVVGIWLNAAFLVLGLLWLIFAVVLASMAAQNGALDEAQQSFESGLQEDYTAPSDLYER